MTSELSPVPGAASPDPSGSIPLPPLFAQVWTEKDRVRAFLADQDNPPPDNMRAEWSCIVRSPGGVEVHGSVEVEPGTSAADVYRRFVALFDVDDPVSLWFSPVRQPAQDVVPSLTELGIGLWDRSGKPIPKHDYVIGIAHRNPYCLAASVYGRDEYFVEVPDSYGRPSFAVMRPNDLMLFDASVQNERLRLYPRVVSTLGYHTAYWAFVRENWPDAAREVARRLVADDRVSRAAESALAAAHAIVRFREFWSFEPAVSRRLAEGLNSMDARLTRWVLSFEKGESTALKELPSLMGAFRAEKPVFAETFRLFYERLGPAVRRAEKRGIGAEELEAGETLVDRLADSSFMTGEHLVFRGSSPIEPDPDATRTETSTQKKNFAAEVLGTLTARADKTLPRRPLADAPTSVNRPAAAPERVARPAPTESSSRPLASSTQHVTSAPQTARGRGPSQEREVHRRGRHEERDSEFVDKLIHINRVAKVVKGGRRFGFAALVVVGDQKGRVGYGHGKAREVPEAIRKATEAAKRSLIRVSLREGRTLHHDVNGRHGAGKVILRAAPQGTGIIAGGPMRAVFETLGMQDVVAKSLGSSNPYNLVRATFDALKNEDSPRSVAARRGMKVSILQDRRRDVERDPERDAEAGAA